MCAFLGMVLKLQCFKLPLLTFNHYIATIRYVFKSNRIIIYRKSHQRHLQKHFSISQCITMFLEIINHFFILLYHISSYFSSRFAYMKKEARNKTFQASPLLDIFLYLHSAFQNDDNRIVFHNSDIFNKATNRHIAVFRKLKVVG